MIIDPAGLGDVYPTRKGFIEYLKSENHNDLAWFVGVGKVSELPNQSKFDLELLKVAYKNSVERELARMRKHAGVLVTTSGWSNEGEVTEPGGVFMLGGHGSQP
jgi:hypothetical protein